MTGPASGDLTGNYPNPQIAPEAVGPAETGVVPAAKAINFSGTSVPNNTPTTIPFDGTTFDYANMHDNVTHNERLTAPIAGVYLVQASLSWDASDGAGVRAINVGGPFGASDVQAQAAPTGNTINNASAIIELFAGDDVTVVATQTSGAALNAGGQFSLIWLGPLAPA